METFAYSEELANRLIKYALKRGADHVALLFQEEDSSSIAVENGELRIFEAGKAAGLGIRLLVDGAQGIASSTVFSLNILKESMEYALKMAKVAKGSIEKVTLASVRPLRVAVESPWKKSPEDYSDEEKLKLVLETNKSAAINGIVSSTTRMGWMTEKRIFESSEGAHVETTVRMAGLAHSSITHLGDKMESVFDSESRCAGFEFITDTNWPEFSRKTSETALKAVNAGTPPSGNYRIVADPKLVGLIFHEALGHASEGDLVAAKESVLEGRLGEKVASQEVTIFDQGIVEGGYYVPYDDEGVEKVRQVVVDKGLLRGFLHSRSSAKKLNALPTGNARCEGFGDRPLVRQTNYFIGVGESNLEELLEDIDYGLYLCGRGARGGEVNVGQGTFTFSAGPSFMIRKGELAEMVRGVSIGGMVLETLNHVSAVGKEISVETRFFGGCGKDGQRARVGVGGPHVRIEKMAVGGRE